MGKVFNEFFLSVCMCVHDKHFLQRAIKKNLAVCKKWQRKFKQNNCMTTPY